MAKKVVMVSRLSRLEEKDRNLTQVEVDEVFGFMSDIRAEVSSNDTVPGRVVLLVELLLNESSNVLLYVVLVQSLDGGVDGIILHLLRHVSILDNGFLVSRHRSKEQDQHIGHSVQ